MAEIIKLSDFNKSNIEACKICRKAFVETDIYEMIKEQVDHAVIHEMQESAGINPATGDKYKRDTGDMSTIFQAYSAVPSAHRHVLTDRFGINCISEAAYTLGLVQRPATHILMKPRAFLEIRDGQDYEVLHRYLDHHVIREPSNPESSAVLFGMDVLVSADLGIEDMIVMINGNGVPGDPNNIVYIRKITY